MRGRVTNSVAPVPATTSFITNVVHLRILKLLGFIEAIRPLPSPPPEGEGVDPLSARRGSVRCKVNDVSYFVDL